MTLPIKEEYDYTKHSLAKKGFYRTYIDEVTGLEVEDVEYNEKCKKMQHLDLAKIFAEEAKEQPEQSVSIFGRVKEFILRLF